MVKFAQYPKFNCIPKVSRCIVVAQDNRKIPDPIEYRLLFFLDLWAIIRSSETNKQTRKSVCCALYWGFRHRTRSSFILIKEMLAAVYMILLQR